MAGGAAFGHRYLGKEERSDLTGTGARATERAYKKQAMDSRRLPKFQVM
jgi:hypothetical protein